MLPPEPNGTGKTLRFAVFDLDDTLYAPECGLWAAISSRIDRYLVEHAQVPPARVPALRRRYHRKFRTTLSGLLHANPALDADAYLQFVHAVPYAELLRTDQRLQRMLAQIALPMAIFTNADRMHAQRVLQCLGVEQFFEAVVDVRDMGFVSKPAPAAYSVLCARLGATPQQCVLFEDSLPNLQTAQLLGMVTVLVGKPGAPKSAAQHRLPDIHGAAELLQRLSSAAAG
jgi:putative hydrolase of the HAD superfamily